MPADKRDPEQSKVAGKIIIAIWCGQRSTRSNRQCGQRRKEQSLVWVLENSTIADAVLSRGAVETPVYRRREGLVGSPTVAGRAVGF